MRVGSVNRILLTMKMAPRRHDCTEKYLEKLHRLTWQTTESLVRTHPEIYGQLVHPLMTLDPDYGLLFDVCLREYESQYKTRSDNVAKFAIFVSTKAAEYPAWDWLRRTGKGAGYLQRLQRLEESPGVVQSFFRSTTKCFYTFSQRWHALVNQLDLVYTLSTADTVSRSLGLDAYPVELPPLM